MWAFPQRGLHLSKFSRSKPASPNSGDQKSDYKVSFLPRQSKRLNLTVEGSWVSQRLTISSEQMPAVNFSTLSLKPQQWDKLKVAVLSSKRPPALGFVHFLRLVVVSILLSRFGFVFLLRGNRLLQAFKETKNILTVPIPFPFNLQWCIGTGPAIAKSCGQVL